ncbi:MAG: aminotransferase [Pseudomonadota bacterium]
MQLNPAMAATEAPPVMEARRWIEGVPFPADRPLINVSQAAPVDPPPKALREALADTALHDDSAHLYGPVLGLPTLREEVAQQFSAAYGGTILPDQVAITAGCNQAFAAALSTLAGAGDEVLLPTPWYFNHKMWLDMAGVVALSLPPGPGLVPDPEQARDCITSRTRAIVLVTPNNPAGVEYPAETVAAFAKIARDNGLALIVDETYRDFDSREAAPHPLFEDTAWPDTLIQLYSFSKAYRLTGHRVGAVVASQARLAELEKFLDTVAICPPQLGQRAALWGMRNLRQWLGGERAEILDRRAAIEAAFAGLAPMGWRLEGCGAYFAYIRHPFDEPSDRLAQRMVRDAGVLCLPGTMFMPEGQGQQHLRVAFANIDRAGIAALADRLRAMGPAPS